jgi:D-glycero-D-manno-heptose 1,7-bisphosphate phosphatase
MEPPMEPVLRPIEEPFKPAIFLDRDGVINHNRAAHVKSWAEFEFLPGVLQALRRLAQLGWPVVVISNQAAIGRGLVSQEAVNEIHCRMIQMVTAAGGHIDAVFYCPHRPEDGCLCRKPNPGLLLQAADELHLNLARSFLVGDAASDIDAASAVRCQPILVQTGRGREQLLLLHAQGAHGYFVADDLGGAVALILRQVAESQFGERQLEWREVEPGLHTFAN